MCTGQLRPIKRVVFSFLHHLLAFRFGKERKTGKYTHMYIYCYFFSTRKAYSEVFYAYVHLRMYVYVRMHFNCIFACMGIRIGAHILNI